MMQDDLDTIEYLKSKAKDVHSDLWWELLEREVRRGTPIEKLGGLFAQGLDTLLITVAAMNKQGKVEKHGSHDQASHGNWARGGADPAAGDSRYAGTLEHIRRFQQGGGPDRELMIRALGGEVLTSGEEDKLIAGFQDVYGLTHTGESKAGFDVTIESKVNNINTSEDIVTVSGTLTDADTRGALGRFERQFTVGDSGLLEVEHVWFKIDDADARGTGFGTKFIRQSEGYYISKGMSRITVHAGLEDGGYTWARAGFDWDNDSVDYTFGSVPDNLDYFLYQNPGVLGGQMETWNRSFQVRDYGSIPTPGELAMAGYTPGATSWPGREIMTGTHWYGEKPLPPPPAPLPPPPEQLAFDTM